MGPRVSDLLFETITAQRILEHPPQRHVHEKLDSHAQLVRLGEVRAALRFEWIVSGLTAVCFWTVPRRPIAGLEGQVRFGFGWTLPRPIESE